MELGEQVLGLSKKEAEELLARFGYNELPSQKKRGFFAVLFGVVREPMLLLLLASGAIYFLVGEPKDASVLLTFVFVVLGITFYQERKTEKALEALKNLSSPKTLVRRSGVERFIPSREVVSGDIVILREGDKVPADAIIISATNLAVNESLLTGESIAVRKVAWDGRMKLTHPGGDDLPFVFSGTLVICGRGLAKVTTVGADTEIGKIGKSLNDIRREDTLLQKEMRRLIRLFAIFGISLCLLVISAYTWLRGDLIKGILSGLTLGMSILPEEFSVILIIFLSLGAWRLSRRKVLTRHAAAIETLGAVTALCVDKTGTITLNRMSLDVMLTGGQSLSLSAKGKNGLSKSFLLLLRHSLLACPTETFDPLEKAIKERASQHLPSMETINSDWQLVREYPIDKSIVALSYVWRLPGGGGLEVSTKGAPETIFDLCHLSLASKAELLSQVEKMSQSGLRVLGVARAISKTDKLPASQHGFDFEFLGLIGFADPIRATVSDSVKECYRAGIRVIMITGDYSGTARFIAKKIGLRNSSKVITGLELEKMDRLLLLKRIKEVNIFARVAPDQKLIIVDALKANGEIVAMTGDGVNDAPALKASNIGVAMGQRGTDVARETADLILLNDDFSSIVSAIKLGRRIFDNLRKAVSFTFAVHIPIVGMSLLPILFNLPIVLFPAHIAFLELIIDPACSTVFEAEKEEAGIMDRPPRNLRQPLLDPQTFVLSLLQGLSILAIVLIVFLLSLYFGFSEREARSMAFATIVFGNVMLIITNLSRINHFINILKNKNKSLFFVAGGAFICLLLVIYLPALNNLFYFSGLRLQDLFLAFVAALFAVIWFEGFKVISSRQNSGKKILS
ncbi:MAG: cation-translocating P-type ATPase [Patescibacteria group bacterium]